MKRIINYVNECFKIENNCLKETIGMDIIMPDAKLVKPINRFPTYELSEFQY